MEPVRLKVHKNLSVMYVKDVRAISDAFINKYSLF